MENVSSLSLRRLGVVSALIALVASLLVVPAQQAAFAAESPVGTHDCTTSGSFEVIETTVSGETKYEVEFQSGFLPSSTRCVGEAVIPDGVHLIGEKAFRSVTGLTAVVFPDSLERIKRWAFDGTEVTSVTIPDNVTQIDANAFDSTPLETLILGFSLQKIGYRAFTPQIPMGPTTIPWLPW